MECIAPLSSLTFHFKRQERWFWLMGTYSPFGRQNSARRISPSLLSDRHNYGACSCVLENSRWCHSWAWHNLCQIRLNLHNPFERGSPLCASLTSSVVSERSCELNDALLLEKEQRLAVASVRTAMKVRSEYVFINTNGDMIGGACRVFHISSIAACPLPFSVIVVWFAVEKPISHCWAN